MCTRMWVCACEGRYPQMQSIGSPEAVVTGNCELLRVGAETQTWVLLPPTRAAHSLIHFPALQYIFITVIISQEWKAFLEASGYVQRCFGMSQERRSTVFTVVLSKFNIRSALGTEKTQCRIWWCTPVISPLEGLKQECHKFKPAWTT